MSNSIKVVCRFRPQNKRELAEGGTVVVDVDDTFTNVRIDNGNDIKADFGFDHIFPIGTKQSDVFEYGIRSTVEDVFNGFNGTVFAYGQTGAGKTFTMMGDMDHDELKGVTPRIIEQIFQTIMESPPTIEFTVKVAYMEIYMEKIRDLLNPVNDNLPVNEDKIRGIYVKGLTDVYVSSVDEVYEVLHRGGSSRIVAYTNMNAESSRSHSIFQVTISQKNLNDGSIKSGRLYLVDLAGSEKVGKTGASGQTLEEAKKINKSLSALGMVINALTDAKAKSKHIPYRDSKLTRILQESLGGNSRTTLIINCSPSSFNDVETIGTLRFGMRAKTIQNKAKVNADLSPAELKALLKKAKTEALTFQEYIKMLEGEVVVWRAGQSVKKEDWANMDKLKGAKPTLAAPSKPSAAASPPTSPTTKTKQLTSPTPTVAVLDSPTRSNSPTFEKLPDDEREAFLKRENELTDQIAEKETEISSLQKMMDEMKSELTTVKDEDKTIKEENKTMSVELVELKMLMDKINYESKETNITLDSLNEQNLELQKELDALKVELMNVKQTQREVVEQEREKKKSEKMAQMMAGLDTNEISAKEKAIRDTLHSLESMNGDGGLSNAEAEALRRELSEARTLIEQQEVNINDLHQENELLTRKRDEIEVRLNALEIEYEDLLDKTIAEEEATGNIDLAETIQDLKSKIEMQYASKREAQQKELDELKDMIERKNEEVLKLNTAVTELRRVNEDLENSLKKAENLNATRAGLSGKDLLDREKEMERIKKTMAQQLADFDMMRKSLMRDLQSRCEQVVELEISLDQVREQYNNALRNANSKVQAKKMAFLERNLEQLTQVQKQLVEQNAQLKKDFAIAERKLAAKNERIQSLEQLLQDAQNKLSTQNQKFETQLQAVRERLDQVKSSKQPPANTFLGFGRIAKPLRGGGAHTAPAPVVDNDHLSPQSITSVLEAEKVPKENKRTSWLWR